MQVNLVYFRPDGERKDIPLHGSDILIGRAEDCNLRIPLAAVSRQHCRISVSDDELVIEDLGSANGIYVNNERVQRQSLAAGDKITVGQAAFVVQIDGKPKKVTVPEPTPGADEIAESELLAESGSDAEASEPVVEVEEVTDQDEAASAKDVTTSDDEGEVVLEEEGAKPAGKKGGSDDGEVAIDLESVEVGNEGAGSSSVEDILLELEASEEEEAKKKS